VTGKQLRDMRKRKGWNQEQMAERLGVSQTYLSLLENGRRTIPRNLLTRAIRLFDLSAVWLPVDKDQFDPANLHQEALAEELAGHGYPGLGHLVSRKGRKNPAELLLSALSQPNLDSRLVEALPWLALTYPEMDWDWLTRAARANDLQNRLGFVLSVARRLAELRGEGSKADELHRVESSLKRSLLAREDTLCHESMTLAERRWLRRNRPPEARQWRLLTDLTPEQYDFAA
jgi:transcriptional regulator with XRE-family HTH domain